MPIFGVNVDEDRHNYICITFDCSYENINTIPILNLLDNYDAKATFFMTGDFIRNNVDWENKGVDDILNNLMIRDAYKAGEILLFHDNAIFTPYALPQVFENIESAGLKCVKVSDLIYKDNFVLDKNGIQIKK